MLYLSSEGAAVFGSSVGSGEPTFSPHAEKSMIAASKKQIKTDVLFIIYHSFCAIQGRNNTSASRLQSTFIVFDMTS